MQLQATGGLPREWFMQNFT